jgi:hypothetical protein
MGRYKALIGPHLHTRGFPALHTEAAIGVTVLNRMLVSGRPGICPLPAGQRVMVGARGQLAFHPQVHQRLTASTSATTGKRNENAHWPSREAHRITIALSHWWPIVCIKCGCSSPLGASPGLSCF